MQIACPACHKTNPVADTAEAACARCGCELAALAAIAHAAEWHLAQAARRLRQGEPGEALARAERSWTLRRSPHAAAVAALAAAASREPRLTLRWRGRV